jgi:hypothetical protein
MRQALKSDELHLIYENSPFDIVVQKSVEAEGEAR